MSSTYSSSVNSSLRNGYRLDAREGVMSEQKPVLVLNHGMGNEAAQAQGRIDLKDHPTVHRRVRRVILAPEVHIAVAVMLNGLESFAGTIPEWHYNGLLPAVVETPR